MKPDPMKHEQQQRTRWVLFWMSCVKYRGLLLLLLPSVIWYLVFQYYTMYGVIIAFKDYRFLDGIWGSPWAGLRHFERLFTNNQFFGLLENTIAISLYKLIFAFPAPIIFALMLNEVRHVAFKKTIQTLTYLPHFISWVVIGGLVQTILSPTSGAVNVVLGLFGVGPFNFMIMPDTFRSIVVLSDIWKSVGWESIIYLAAISGIDQEMYEAARIDGANRFRQAVSITIPCILPVVIIMLILQIGNLMEAGFGQILNLYNPTVYSVADIFDTYAYRVGLVNFDFSYATAISLFKNTVGLILILLAHQFSKRVSGQGIW